MADLSRLRLLFGNGLGRNFNLGTGIDLLDTGGETPSGDFNFWGRVEWLPTGGDTGLEFHPGAERYYREIGIWPEADTSEADATDGR